MSSSNVDPMKKSSIYATFGRYYGEKLYRLLYDCCTGVGSFCYEVWKCLGISSEGNPNKVLNEKGQWVGIIPIKFTDNINIDLDNFYLQFGDVAGGNFGIAFGNFTPLGGNPNSFSMKWDTLLMESEQTMNLISQDSIDIQPELHLNVFLKTGQSVHILDNSLADSFEFREDGIAVLSKYASLNFADDTAAAAGGVPLGGVYHNNGALRTRVV